MDYVLGVFVCLHLCVCICACTHLNVSVVILVYWHTSSNADPSGTYSTKEWLERVIVVGINKPPSSISISSGKYLITTSGPGVIITSILDDGKQDLRFKYDSSKRTLEIKKPGLNISKDFTISLN